MPRLFTDIISLQQTSLIADNPYTISKCKNSWNFSPYAPFSFPNLFKLFQYCNNNKKKFKTKPQSQTSWGWLWDIQIYSSRNIEITKKKNKCKVLLQCINFNVFFLMRTEKKSFFFFCDKVNLMCIACAIMIKY